MINYIEANCHPTPLESHPNYDEDSDMWDLRFIDKEDASVIRVSLESLEEAQETIKKCLQLALEQEQRDAVDDSPTV
tara:strand:+ start:840 stop:1070 length:231 start_codon:yes stop_codon:yes gene_type:complete